MTTPPNAHISAAMWEFWLRFSAAEPGVRLGGIYASKAGYHNYRDALPASDYSVAQYAADREGSGQLAAAIDLTFPSAQAGDHRVISRYSARLLASGRDPDDERGNYLREFYGQADADTGVEGWDFQAVEPATSDDSHLWHIHVSVMRKYAADRIAMDALYSILAGEPVAAWRTRTNGGTTIGEDMDPKIEQSLGEFLTYAYNPFGPAVSSKSWAAQAIEQPLRRIEAQLAGLGDMRAAVVAALADPAVVAALADALPDGVDQAVVEAALREVLRTGVGSAT